MRRSGEGIYNAELTAVYKEAGEEWFCGVMRNADKTALLHYYTKAVLHAEKLFFGK